MRQPLIVLDRELRVQTANRSFYQMFQVLPAQIERQPFFELGDGQQNNASVTAVASAHGALEALNQSLPDIIVSDISMPEVDGYTLMRQIRALPPQGGQIPAIALTLPMLKKAIANGL